ncbi:MAG: adenosylmethionine--8-amino-7-oxononanoate transaminase [Myxococcota bacterium]|nr:adenosylmethionine--8-amino-7-oxononanoate transaminase [Myxococcota bacterium]
MTPSSLQLEDRKFTWHPFTQQHQAPIPIPVVRANGSYLQTEDGHQILDCISSWWTNIHGHGNPKIVQAIADQAATLDHVLFAGCTHPKAVEVAKRLQQVSPPGIERTFFSDNGSTAVEVALKMAYQYWRNKGLPAKKKFIAFDGAYHGDTIGAMSAGDPKEFGVTFQSLLIPIERLPLPKWKQENFETIISQLRELLTEKNQHYAGIIIEPMVQGAGGMKIYSSAFLGELRHICDQFNVLLIADEVMTGFGRTGKLFAMEHAEITPDIMCIAKGLTGGVLPLAATLTTSDIYEAFLDESIEKAFLHGHSFTANPIACAAAVASLDIFSEPETLAQSLTIENYYAHRLPTLNRHSTVKETRWLGSIGVVELNCGTTSYFNQIGQQIREYFFKRGFLARPLGNVFYTLPPLSTSIEEIESIYDTLEEFLETL